MSRRLRACRVATGADLIAGGLGTLALLAGVGVLAATSGAVAESIGIGLLGLSGVAFVSLVFLLVGESEDRDNRRKGP